MRILKFRNVYDFRSSRFIMIWTVKSELWCNTYTLYKSTGAISVVYLGIHSSNYA